jgi:Fur family zinc uptake transcriptional regulator
MKSNQIVTPFKRPDHQHSRCLESVLAKVEASCAGRGLRLTNLRRRVLELVWRGHEPVKAYELLEVLRAEKKGAAPPTVYRALDFLRQEGFVHRIESLNAYVGCGEPGHNNTAQFLICHQCGTVAELDDADIQDLISDKAGGLGFRIRHQTIEVQGLCTACSQA